MGEKSVRPGSVPTGAARCQTSVFSKLYYYQLTVTFILTKKSPDMVMAASAQNRYNRVHRKKLLNLSISFLLI